MAAKTPLPPPKKRKSVVTWWKRRPQEFYDQTRMLKPPLNIYICQTRSTAFPGSITTYVSPASQEDFSKLFFHLHTKWQNIISNCNYSSTNPLPPPPPPPPSSKKQSPSIVINVPKEKEKKNFYAATGTNVPLHCVPSVKRRRRSFDGA